MLLRAIFFVGALAIAFAGRATVDDVSKIHTSLQIILIGPHSSCKVIYLDTIHGRIVIRMFPEHAPNHVARIKELVRSGFYDGIDWHRVMAG